jgi:hypothetical protein
LVRLMRRCLGSGAAVAGPGADVADPGADVAGPGANVAGEAVSDNEGLLEVLLRTCWSLSGHRRVQHELSMLSVGTELVLAIASDRSVTTMANQRT